ncbi:hypothetical protein [Microbispora sp. KK1-11]|uniref:hypothetical protein n=1 Tax=Microbispora sp. KK1-11 TaxID=2053005 RepID=UPI00115AB099|nr:hypothetical protein [Microbispora sp. KK1-11]TQS30350.1 hypothetical protein FLW16_03500 [Microbispora sp. KK1-11]
MVAGPDSWDGLPGEITDECGQRNLGHDRGARRAPCTSACHLYELFTGTSGLSSRRVTVVDGVDRSRLEPAQGLGANCALLDAAVLCRALSDAVTAGLPLACAIGDYERRMTDYGFAAVRASERAAMARSGPLTRAISRLERMLS